MFSSWRDASLYDRNPEAFGLTGYRAFIASLPHEADACIEHCLRILSPQKIDLADFLHRQLATIAGWAGYVQYLVREDTMRGRTNSTLHDLLAIRIAYDAALFSAFANDGVFMADWQSQSMPRSDSAQLAALTRWQLAYEIGYQRNLAHALAAQPSVHPEVRPAAQAVFCIDVRSEIFRRHLETGAPGLQTTGFAGFFGFPVAHEPAAAPSGARCPVLLVPPVDTCEPLSPAEAATAKANAAETGAWKAFQNSATSCFSFVESVGLTFGAVLGKTARPVSPSCSRVAPDFKSASPEMRLALAEGALRNMSLTKNFARLVLICGHGSQSANNPYASALDCGACGGHAGDVNARIAATTFNDPQVRKGLAAKGIMIPEDTVFVAGLHNTANDDVTLFDLELVPASHSGDINQIRNALLYAGSLTRRERAPKLGLSAVPAELIEAAVRERAHDISQVRTEWALANNAALIVAPRSRTAALKLDSRAFLHDYDAAADTDNKVLTLILCAPVVVGSWINLQYYASRVDPLRYGGGNKILHNVVGGIGVIEGNSGDLKVGLPLQSIHDGEKFVHEPRRLTVFIDVARERIDNVLAAQAGVRQLFDNSWSHLVALEGKHAYRYTLDGWQPL